MAKKSKKNGHTVNRDQGVFKNTPCRDVSVEVEAETNKPIDAQLEDVVKTEPAKKTRKRKKPYQSISERQASKAAAQLNGGVKGVTQGFTVGVPEISLASMLKKIVPRNLQPNPKGYGGMGFAKASAWIDLRDEEFMDKYLELYDEHIEGFSGKAFQKARRRELSQDMLWRVKLREKQAASNPNDGNADTANNDNVNNSTSSGGGKKNKKNKSKVMSSSDFLDSMGSNGIVVPNRAKCGFSRLGGFGMNSNSNINNSSKPFVPIGGVGAGKQKSSKSNGSTISTTSSRSDLATRPKLKSKQWIEEATAGVRAKTKSVGVDDKTRQTAIDLYRAQQRLKKQKHVQARNARQKK